MKRVVFRNSVGDGDVKETSDQSGLEWASLIIMMEREQRDRYGRPDREYLATYIAAPESNHQAPGLGPAIVFRSSIGAPPRQLCPVWELRRAPLTAPISKLGLEGFGSTVVLVACTGLAASNVASQLDQVGRMSSG